MKGHDIQAGRTRPVGIAGAAAAAFGKEHHRPFPLLGQLEHAVFFVVVLEPLGAGQDRVVVGQHDALGALVVKQIAVDAADTGQHAVGRRVLDQVFERTALALGGDDHRAVLDKAIGIAQGSDILTAGALAGLATTGDGLRPGGVKPDLVPFDHLGQVGTNVVQIDLLLLA